jgi:hypothetical protein
MTVYFDRNACAFGKCVIHSVIEEVSVCLSRSFDLKAFSLDTRKQSLFLLTVVCTVVGERGQLSCQPVTEGCNNCIKMCNQKNQNIAVKVAVHVCVET